MGWKKNDLIEVRIEDISNTGEGIGKTNGYTWFVKDAVIGDIVAAKVMKVKKSYGYARLMEILEPSGSRVPPRCPVSRQCGGCQLQAMSYEEQLKFKEKKVFNNLCRIGGFDNLGVTIPFSSIIGMENPWRYRNKALFPFGLSPEGRTITGFYAGRTHTIIENDDCLLGAEENTRILSCIKQYMAEYQLFPYDENTHTGLVRHVLIRKAFRTGELMVCLVINGDAKALKNPEVLVQRLCGLFGEENLIDEGLHGEAPRTDAGGMAVTSKKRVGKAGTKEIISPHMVSISCCINRERTNVIMGQEIINLYGSGYITDYIGDVKYRISPLSFYQVNAVQTEQLYRSVMEYAGLTGQEIVWDLYCGIGAISLFLAPNAKKVYGVEVIPQAIEDARANAAINGIMNVEFFLGRAEEILPAQYSQRHIYADVVVVDPPRKGCDQACLDTILQISPKKIVYVSCDPATLARDLKYLCTYGYEVREVQAVDMFPGSVHVETVCLLSNRKPDTKVRIDVDLEDYYRIKDAKKNQN